MFGEWRSSEQPEKQSYLKHVGVGAYINNSIIHLLCYTEQLLLPAVFD